MLRNEHGQTIVEYALLVIGVGLALAILMSALGISLIEGIDSTVEGWLG